MHTWKVLSSLILICSLLLFYACQKVKELPGENKSQEQKAGAIQPAYLNLEQIPQEQLQSFEGCLEPGMLSQESALANLKILAAGDHETIRYYREFQQSENRMPMGSSESWYENDICATVRVLSKKNTPEAYDLILQVIEQKTGYPKARICAIRAIMIYGKFKDGLWHGDKRSIPVLKKAINDKDPDIRLNTAGALLSLGEGKTALPVIDELAKAGTEQSIPALYKLFTPEEKETRGVKTIIRSQTRLFDEQGKVLLVKALNYSSDEVKAFAALKLVHMGIELEKAENTAIEVLKQRMLNKKQGYQNFTEQQSDRNTVKNAIAVLEIAASNDSANVIKTFGEGSSDPSLKAMAQIALKNIKQKNNVLK